MRKVIIGFAVLVGIIVLLGIVAPFLIPAGLYRDQIIAAAQSATGRQLRIDGPISVTVLPNVAVEASGVALSNAPGGVAKEMATLGKLQVGLKLLPLLSGDVEIDRLVLVDPVIHLEIDKEGRPNWDFGTAPTAKPASVGVATPQATQKQAAQKQAEGLRELRLGDIELVNGTIDYVDTRTSAHQELSHVDVAIKLPSLDQPSSVDGDLTWRSKTIKLALSIDRPRALFDAGASAAKASISSDPVKLSFNGSFTGGESFRIGGTLNLDVPSIRDLAAWTGNPIALRGSGLGPFSVKGKLAASGPTIALSDVSLAVDAIKAQGNIAIDAGGAKPAVKGKLDIDMLDLNPYLGSPLRTAGTATAPPGPATAPAQAGWSTQPIDFSPLKEADIDFAIGTNGIRYEKIDIGKSALGIALQNGRLTADLTQLALYQGSGKGKIALDASGVTPAIEASFALNGVQTGPLLTAAIDFSRITGVGDLNFALSSHGANQRDIVGALTGKGNFGFHNGTIKGLDLIAMVKNVSQAFLSAAGGSSQQTEFSELTGSFTVTNGIAKTDDVALKAPAIQLAGAGTVDLPQRRLDFRVEPTVGLGGQNLAVPVLITGPWSNPSYQPDLKSILSQKLGKPGNLLQGLKGAATPPGSASGTSSKPKPADVLKGIFGGK